MTFESMSNIAAQQDYEQALQELLANPAGAGYNKAMNALMKLYPQWKQYEWEHCLQEDLREAREAQ
jgi:hypothetical protein